MFVISIKKLYDSLGNKLDKPEYEYFGYDKYAGSFSTGYPTWIRFCNAETFKTAKEAKEIYLKNLHYLICSWGSYDRDSIRIREIKFKPIEALPWKINED